MNRKTAAGLAMIVVSLGQLVVPSRIFDHPDAFLFGFPVVPAGVLAYSAAFFTMGVIVASEGICERFGCPSLAALGNRSIGLLLRVLLGGAIAGVVLEFLGAWLARLWIYPYWTWWFYALVVVPGFAFYWISIVESYLAAKSVVDRYLPAGPETVPLPRWAAGAGGAVALVASIALYADWYASRGGFAATPTTPTRVAPPYWYGLLAVTGLWLGAEWVLRGRGLLGRLRGSVLAILLASAVLSVLMELPNAVHHHWAYQNFPAQGVQAVGVPVMVFVAWPLQYVVLLLVPCLVAPELAEVFWAGQRRAAPAR